MLTPLPLYVGLAHQQHEFDHAGRRQAWINPASRRGWGAATLGAAKFFRPTAKSYRCVLLMYT